MSPNSRSRRPSKDESERAYLTGFLAASGLVTGEAPKRPQQEPPDFVANLDGRRIAIEITRVHQDDDENGGSTLRAGESNREWVCREVAALIAKAGVKPLHVSISFAHDELNGKRRHSLAREIVGLILANNPNDSTLTELNWRDYEETGQYGKVWPEELNGLTLLRCPWSTLHEVHGDDVGWMFESFVEHLQATVLRKGADQSGYAELYDETWLLIVAEGFGPSSFFSPGSETREHAYTSPFGRTFFFDHFGRKWFELRTRADGV